MIDYYEILELPPNSSAEDISARIKEKKRLWVQRQNAPKLEQRREAEENLQIIPAMEDTLLDAAKRAAYDSDLQGRPPLPPPPAPELTGNSNKLLEECAELLKAEKIPAALEKANQACLEDSENHLAWLLKGQCHSRWDQQEEAIESYSRASSLKPNDSLAYYHLGCIYKDAGLLNESEQQFLRAKQISPDDIDCDTSLAEIEYHRKNFDGCILILEDCLQRDPDNDHRSLLALAYRDKGMEDWTHIDENNIIATRKEQVEKAETWLAKARKLNSSSPNVAELIQETEASIEGARKRAFHGNPVAPAIWGLMGLFVMGLPLFGAGEASWKGSDIFGAFVFGLFYLLAAGAYVASCMTPGYLINRRAANGGGETSLDAITEDGGCLGMILQFALITAMMPIFAIVNFFRNYIFV